MLLDPNDERVIEGARANGIAEDVMESARKSPIWRFVKEWGLALPLHAEHRTLPMLFYVPPLLPVLAKLGDGGYDTSMDEFVGSMDKHRLPIQYMASLFGGGNEGVVRYALQKQQAVRMYRRNKTVGDLDEEMVAKVLAEADCTEEQAEAIYHLTSIATLDDRFVIPPMHREEAIELLGDSLEAKGAGVGFRTGPERGA